MNSLSVNNQNRITNPGFSYDAAGNMTSDGVYTYQYDAENRLVSVNSGAVASYTYDAIGRRVAKTVGGAVRDYVYQVDGTVGAENVPAGWNVGYVYLNGQMPCPERSRRMAQYKDGTTWFAHLDHLGSTRGLSTVAGAWMIGYDYLPGVYPERSRRGETGNDNSGTSHKFTGQERDSESGLDYFLARHYSSTIGRFLQPDEFAGGPPSLTYPET